MWEAISAIAFPLPSNPLLVLFPAIAASAQFSTGLNEAQGTNFNYSKFFDSSKTPLALKIPSRVGMVALYSPAALTAAAAAFNSDGTVMILSSMLALHFVKRVLESLFLHRYSGIMAADTLATILFHYLSSTALIIYTQWLTVEEAAPSVDLKPAGIFLFSIGIFGNLYHHCLLCNLRREGDKQYKIPHGGLFGLVTCPHYLFEILIFVGIACASQTACAFCVMMGTIFYLMGRSWATRK
ncbi:3-oxo-5-alpha-steroid 4-dehydrogenase family protein isoform X2 [Wolffia australiana]